MKYIRKYNEDLEWEFDEEESNEIKDFEDYIILYNTSEECQLIVRKLIELGYNVYGFSKLGTSITGDFDDCDTWHGFRYKKEKDIWVQTISNIDKKLRYKDIEKL